MSLSVLVTGGAGYIGAHTAKALVRAGFHPVTLDNLSTGHRDFVRWGPLIEADIAETDVIEHVCRTHNIGAAIHFAANALVGESVTDPAIYYKNNVSGTLGLLEGLRRAQVTKIVFSSSCAVYGTPERQPIDETTPRDPINPYGATKLMVERILADYGQAYCLRSVSLRYFNACGADLDAEIGEYRAVETHLIPRAMMWLQGYLENFQVYGTDFPTADGSAVRDYVHVSDLADAHVQALKHLQNGGEGGTFNLGSGAGHSVREVIAKIMQITGLPISEVAGGRRAGDPAMLVADISLARRTLGFSPTCSDLDTIVRSAWKWHQKAHPASRADLRNKSAKNKEMSN